MPGRDWEDDCYGSIVTLLDGIETGVMVCIPGAAWRVPAYWPGGVRCRGGVSPVCCSRAEREKACPDTAAVSKQRQGVPDWDVSTVAGQAGGPARSSAEAAVMGVEPRGRVVRGGVRPINQAVAGGGIV